MVSKNSSLCIGDCTFEDNCAKKSGGAMCFASGFKLINLSANLFTSNKASKDNDVAYL